jgi:putative ABC transport system permease protein
LIPTGETLRSSQRTEGLLFDDFAFAVRRLRQSPRLALAVIVLLGLTVGVNVAVFSVADAVLFRRLPYAEAGDLFVLRTADVRTGRRFTLVRYQHLDLLAVHVPAITGIATLESAPRLVASTADGARNVAAIAVSANYFDVLGARAARGRLFTSADGSAPGRPALLAYYTWRESFGGDERIVGRSITFDRTTFDVIGVLPADFVFPLVFATKPAIVTLLPPRPVGAEGGTFYPVVRLSDGALRSQVQAQVDALFSRAAPIDSRSGTSLALEDVRAILYPTGRPIMALLLAAAGFVLVIGCTNLAIVLAVRGRRLEHETAVRAALGASRLRLVRPLVFEALLLGLGGGALALLAAAGSFGALIRQVPPVAFGSAPVGIDVRVGLFALGLGLAGGLLAIAAPAWRLARSPLRPLLQSVANSSRAGRGVGAPLLAMQVALAIVLLFGAIAVARAFVAVLGVPLGFSPDGVLLVRMSPPQRVTDRQGFYRGVVEALAARPDVVAAGAAGSMPLDGAGADERAVAGDSPQRTAAIVHVLPGYFEATGIHLVRGRLLDDRDLDGGGEAAMVSEAAARVLFPGSDPVGARFGNGRGRTFTVVGVVADVLKSHASQQAPCAYVIPNQAARLLTILVRMRTRGEATLLGVRRAVQALTPDEPVTVRWWSDAIAAVTAYRNPRFQTLVLGTFAALALGLTALGMFAVVSFTMESRTRELGIRIALGASPQSLVAQSVRRVAVPVACGIALGLLGTRWFGAFARAQLFEVHTYDPTTLAAATVIVAASAIAAAYIPARRVSRVDPMVVLRE